MRKYQPILYVIIAISLGTFILNRIFALLAWMWHTAFSIMGILLIVYIVQWIRYGKQQKRDADKHD